MYQYKMSLLIWLQYQDSNFLHDDIPALGAKLWAVELDCHATVIMAVSTVVFHSSSGSAGWTCILFRIILTET